MSIRIKPLIIAVACCLLLPAAVSASSLPETLSAKTGVKADAAQAQIAAVFDAMQTELKSGRDVTVRNFGKFYLQSRDARVGRNPKTGEQIQIPARKYPRFRSAEGLKSAVNN